MKSKKVKLVLDIIMIVMILLMLKDDLISKSYHEISGLILGGIFVIHLAGNWRWIVNVTKKIRSRETPGNIKAMYLAGVLLVISFGLTIFGGIMMSEVVFHFQVRGPWKTIHYTFAAVSLILVGVHVGFNWEFVKSMCGKWFRFLGDAAGTVGKAVLILFLLFGLYNIADTDFLEWLAMPVEAIEDSIEHREYQFEKEFKDDDDHEYREKKYDDDDGYERKIKKEHKKKDGLRFDKIVETVIKYLSIVSVFAALTWWIKRRGGKRKVH